jgi:hypothetical protein
MSREYAKVITIIAKMEQLRGNRELNEIIHNSIHKWVEIIRNLQMKRKYEIQKNANIANIGLVEESFVEQMPDTIKDLASIVRTVRTSLWSALILTLYEKTFNFFFFYFILETV